MTETSAPRVGLVRFANAAILAAVCMPAQRATLPSIVVSTLARAAGIVAPSGKIGAEPFNIMIIEEIEWCEKSLCSPEQRATVGMPPPIESVRALPVADVAPLIDRLYTRDEQRLICRTLAPTRGLHATTLVGAFRKLIVFDAAAEALFTAVTGGAPLPAPNHAAAVGVARHSGSREEILAMFRADLPAAAGIVFGFQRGGTAGAQPSESPDRKTCATFYDCVMMFTAALTAAIGLSISRGGPPRPPDGTFRIDDDSVAMARTALTCLALSAAPRHISHGPRCVGCAPVDPAALSVFTRDVAHGLRSFGFVPARGAPDSSVAPFPTDAIASVAGAAANVKINLSTSECPLVDYYKLALDFAAEYGPDERQWRERTHEAVDVWFRPATFGSRFQHLYTQTPEPFSIAATYSSNFAAFYTEETQRGILSDQCFCVRNVGGVRVISGHDYADSGDNSGGLVAYDSETAALRVSEGAFTFVYGRHPLTANENSPIWCDTLDDYTPRGNNAIVSAGVFGGASPSASAFFARDLLDYFQNAGSLSVPVGAAQHFVTRRAAETLRRVCETYSHQHCTLERLGEKIAALCGAEFPGTARANEIRALPDGDRAAAAAAYTALLKAGMCMRGHGTARVSGAPPGAWPLASLDTVTEPSAYAEIEERVHAAMIEFFEAVDAIACERARALVRTSPLIVKNYARDEQKASYVIPTNMTSQGATIHERMAIVAQGEEGSIFSCMRMSSNMVVSSAYFYLERACAAVPDFRIEDLAFIS
jgi:hypothetical protein